MTTHVLMIVDMSGSMAALAADVRGGFNTYLNGLREDTNADYKISVTLFDHRYMPLCTAATVERAPELTDANYQPAGSTALLDAVGRTVGAFDQATTLADGDRVLVVIQTDGYENASQEWSFPDVTKLIETREATGAWSFTYLGAGADSWDQAAKMGVNRAQYVNTAKTAAGTTATYSGLTTATRAYAGGRSAAESAEIIRGTAGV